MVLDRLELLERLPAALAVAQRAARGRAEDVLQARLRRAAVRAAERARLQLDELRAAGRARRGWREAGLAQLLAALRRDAVGRPVVDHVDLRLRAELRHARGDRVAHRLERRAAEERRCELDAHAVAAHLDVADDAEVDE